MSTPAPTGSDIAEVSRLLSEPTRAEACAILMDGRSWTSGELAAATGVSASTMSEHLSQLVTGGLLSEARQGRHRYVRLAGGDVAHLIETLGNLSARRGNNASGYRQVKASQAMQDGRTCYDHLAGALGMAITDALVTRGLIRREDHDMTLTTAGARWLARTGIALPQDSRRPMVRSCLDWTERRHHVAGQVGAALCTHLFRIGAIARSTPKRAVKLTDVGRTWLQTELSLSDTDLPR